MSPPPPPPPAEQFSSHPAPAMEPGTFLPSPWCVEVLGGGQQGAELPWAQLWRAYGCCEWRASPPCPGPVATPAPLTGPLHGGLTLLLGGAPSALRRLPAAAPISRCVGGPQGTPCSLPPLSFSTVCRYPGVVRARAALCMYGRGLRNAATWTPTQDRYGRRCLTSPPCGPTATRSSHGRLMWYCWGRPGLQPQANRSWDARPGRRAGSPSGAPRGFTERGHL